MKLSGGVEWALHCCVVLTTSADPVPAARLAELHEVSGSYPAKHLQVLSRADLVSSVQGKAGGYVLTRAPDRDTVLDVVVALEGSQPAFRVHRDPSSQRPDTPTARPRQLSQIRRRQLTFHDGSSSRLTVFSLHTLIIVRRLPT